MTNHQPTAAELEILQALWQLGPATVRQVNAELNRNRRVGYTTTLKMMQIMTEKGLLSRDTKQRSHLYIPRVREKEAQTILLDKLKNSVFGGSALKLVASALGNAKPSPDEIKAIRELLKRVETRNGDSDAADQ